MGLMFWYLLALAIMIIWTVAVSAIWSKWKTSLEKRSIVCMGPFVMWKTQRGKELIERIATTRKRLVGAYGRISVGITGVSMVTMTSLLVLSAYLVFTRARDIDIEPHMLLGLPGLNPIIPLWYGILGLVVAMVVHEFSHGLLTILAKVKLISLGVMFFIFPMGAFVEPDEEAIKKVDKKRRVRMYASGPAANIIVAGIFTLVFSMILMTSVSVAHEGVGIISDPQPLRINDEVISTPAMDANLTKGMIIFSIDGEQVTNRAELNNALNATLPGQVVTIEYYSEGPHTTEIALANKSLYYWESYNKRWGDNYTAGFLSAMGWGYSVENVTKAQEWYFNKGYLGVATMRVSTEYFRPIGGSGSPREALASVAFYITLPLQRLSPVDGVLANFYVIDGFWSFLPDNVFWVLANACYWIFWLNLMVGLSNALPAVPLDGGYIFKDWLDSLLSKFRAFGESGKRKKTVDTVATALAFTILFLILWQVIGPRVL